MARENYASDNVLEVLFRMAVTAAKRVKDGGGSYRSQSFRDPSGPGDSEGDRGFPSKRTEVYGHRKRCNGKTDGLHAVCPRGRM